MNIRMNFRSIKFRVWLLFLLYAALIMGVMWFLQIFFLNNYYEDMKIKDTTDTATQLASDYKAEDTSTFLTNVSAVSEANDIYIQVEERGDITYPISDYDYSYASYVNEARTLLKASKLNSVSKTLDGKVASRNYLLYAGYLDKDRSAVMYMVTPLYPVASTTKIIRNQLIYIMIIALALAFIISFYMSSRISRPIRDITRSTRRLADGEYGAVFHAEGQYSEIQDLANALNRTSYELAKTTKLQHDLMANVSHDLRTPLTMIKSYAEMIRDLSGDVPEKREKHLKTIIEEADRLNVFVNDILELSRMQAGTAQLHITSFDICSLVRQLAAPYHVLEERSGYDIRLSAPETLYVNGDLDKITVVLSNLISNAVKYCGSDRKIAINIRRWNSIVHVDIKDHGIGIKPEELQYIWERYYKASSHHVRTTNGSGLGLSIVREILQLHKTKFGVESKIGKGTTFWFELPVADPPEE